MCFCNCGSRRGWISGLRGLASAPQRELDATNDKPLMKISDEEPEGYWPISRASLLTSGNLTPVAITHGVSRRNCRRCSRPKRLRSGLLEKSAFSEFPVSWRRILRRYLAYNLESLSGISHERRTLAQCGLL